MPGKKQYKSKQDDDFIEDFKSLKKAFKKAANKVKTTANKTVNVVKKTANKTVNVVKKVAKKGGPFNAIAKAVAKAVNKVVKKITKAITDFFMIPINLLKKSILKPFTGINDGIRTIICFAIFLQLVFKWCAETFVLLTKYFFAAPLCFGFWILNSLMLCLQYIIIDVILSVILKPAVYIGNELGYPFVGDIKITRDNKKNLYKNTNLIQIAIKFIDSKLKLPFKIYDKCFDIGGIAPFPKYYS